jgi:GNAT superfamily N-acetyltransferase
MLYRVVRLDNAPMLPTLAAIRPVVTSQLLGAWLHDRDEAFTVDEACAAVEEFIASPPPRIFVDPELRGHARRMVRAALPLMVNWNILQRDGDRYRTTADRRHPQFPFVRDILAYQAAFLEETLENAHYGDVLTG